MSSTHEDGLEPGSEPRPLPEDIDQETPEELIAYGKRAQVWNTRSLYFLAASIVLMLLVFFFSESMPLRVASASLLMVAGATAMATTMAVFSLRTERKRLGIGKLHLGEDDEEVNDEG